MSSPSASVIASNQEPRLRVAADGLPTNGDLAADLAADYGLIPDPWQQLVLNDWLAESNGRYAALTCGTAVPRQNGKNGIIEVRELFGTVGRGEKILHTAHEVKTARKAFKRLQHFFGRQVNDPAAKFPELNALVVELRNVNGQEAIFLANGGSVEIVARSKNSGRGFTADVLVMDEAQELSEEDLEALMPTTSAAPLGNPQWIFTGTPPGPNVNGEVFSRTRAEALSANPYRLAWHEWSVDAEDVEGIDLDDRTLWHLTNPALGSRLQLEVIEGERARVSREGFARERLGWWQPHGQGSDAFDWPTWMSLIDVNPTVTAPSFGIATAPDRSWSAVAAAWKRPDGAIQLLLGDDYRRDATWVPGRGRELRSRYGGRIVADTASRGLVEGAVEPGEGEQAKAENALSDLIQSGQIRHGNEPALNTAVRAARWKLSGNTRVLDRKGSVDISPIRAAAMAVHGLTTAPATGGWMVGV